MKRTLYISDLDGTLLGADSRLSSATVGLLNEAIAEGALFSIATARTPATVSQLMKDVNLNLPLIVMTGAALWDNASQTYSDVQYMSAEATRRVIETYRTCGASVFLYTLPRPEDPLEVAGPFFRKLVIYHIGRMNAIENGFMLERILSPYKRFEIPASGESVLPKTITDTVLFFGMQPTSVAEKVYDKLGMIPDINPMFYHDWYGEDFAEVEAFPPGATKALAIRRLARLAGAERVVVFGDNKNDISMMLEADMAVAVGNAIPEVRKVAHRVIGANTEDAVAKFIIEDFRSNS